MWHNLAIGAVRALGYFGCLMAGCCHGRPSRWRVVYRERHAAALPQTLLGVRLFPIQVVESLWIFGVVVAGYTCEKDIAKVAGTFDRARISS